MKDLLIIPDVSGSVSFYPRGESEDTGMMLLQRLYVLIFSDPSIGFRLGDGGYTLWSFLEGGNIPSKEIFDTMLAASCTTAVKMLEPSDQALISSFSASGDTDGSATFTLTLKDGTTVKGKLTNG